MPIEISRVVRKISWKIKNLKEPLPAIKERVMVSYLVRVTLTAGWLLEALIDARRTIREMPAFYIKYPNGNDQVFKTVTSGRLNRTGDFVLDADFLWEFGELHIPRHIWQAMCRFASWIEPSLITEWIRLMQSYSEKIGKSRSYDELMKSLTWIAPERQKAPTRALRCRPLLPIFSMAMRGPLESDAGLQSTKPARDKR
jgi:hypothetical protein